MAEHARRRETVRIYRRLLGARIRAEAQYRVALVLLTMSQAGASALEFVAIAVLFSQVRALGGWSEYQVLFLYGLSSASFAFSDLLFGSTDRATLHIKAGSFDQFLIRPLGPLGQLNCAEFAFRRVGRIAPPSVVAIIAMAHLGLHWTPARLVVVVSSVLGGVAIFGAIWLTTSAMAFWTVETQEIANAFTSGGSVVAEYPLDVMSVWLRRFALVVPIAFVIYLPSTWLLQKPDVYGLPVALRLSSPVVGLIALCAAAGFWRSAIGHYRSTGT